MISFFVLAAYGVSCYRHKDECEAWHSGVFATVYLCSFLISAVIAFLNGISMVDYV